METFQQSVPKGKISARRGLTDGGLYVDDFQVSSYGANTSVMRGVVTLANGSFTATLPRALISAASGANITFLVTPRTNNPMFVDTIVSATTFGSVNISSVTGFKVSGSGTDTGYWQAMGYTK